MVFRGTNLDPMFAAADANDGDLTSGIYNGDASSIWTRQSFALRVRDREAFDGRRLWRLQATTSS
jgi:hypothetical protein